MRVTFAWDVFGILQNIGSFTTENELERVNIMFTKYGSSTYQV